MQIPSLLFINGSSNGIRLNFNFHVKALTFLLIGKFRTFVKHFSVQFHRNVIQVCQMVYFQAKNPNFGKFWRALDWKMLIYFMIIRNSLCTIQYFKTIRYIHFVFVWYIFSSFGIMHR
jgi:hypothetical protein